MRTTLGDFCPEGYFDSTFAFVGVDLQNDFGNPKGSLYVNGGDRISYKIMRLAEWFNPSNVFWTKDWHPENHCSFKVNGGSWPIHCVQNQWGSEIMNDINVLDFDVTILKGSDVGVDSYSAFFDNDHKTETELNGLLKDRMVTSLVVCGIATDYCVKFTVLDAIKLGYKVAVYLPGCAGVGPIPGVTDKTVEDAIKEMEDAGAVILES